jgi:uncharacterized protein YdiU (UPF0061 family)
MSNLLELNYQQHFQSLPLARYTPIKPQGITNPRLELTSDTCAKLIGIDASSLNTPDG